MKIKFDQPGWCLPFLFLSNRSKTFSKPFLLALSSPSLFICMKAIVWSGQAPAWSAAKTSTGASCRYWKRKIGNQKASGQWSRGPKKAFLFVRINANLISFTISMSIFNTFEIFRMFLTNLNVKYCKQYPIFRKLDMYRSTNFSFPKKFHLSSSPNPGQILMSYLFLN